MKPEITAFFDEPTFTVSYVVADPESRRCAVIDERRRCVARAGRHEACQQYENQRRKKLSAGLEHVGFPPLCLSVSAVVASRRAA